MLYYTYMIIYRYEYLDGGGPFLTRDGTSRTHPEYSFNDNTLYGCDTIEHLNEWFNSRNITLPNTIWLCKYYGEPVYEYPNTGEVIIQKDTAKILSRTRLGECICPNI